MTQNRSTHTGEGGKTKRPRTLKHDIISRVKSLYALLIICGIAVIVRFVWIIAISPSVRHNAEVMKEGIYRYSDIEAHRGTIFSRDGEPLAISSLRYSILLDFGSEGMIEADTAAYLKNVDALSQLLATHFSEEDAAEHNYKYISAAEYRYRLITERERKDKKRRAYKILPRTITIDEWNMMRRNYPIFNGNMGYVLSAQPNDKRLYPSGDIARQTIGRSDTIIVREKIASGDTTIFKEKKVPGTGLEGLYNNYLAGKNGRSKEQWIAHGFWTRVADKKNRPVENGANVITTIDAGLQRMAHVRLDSMLRRQQASFGVAMVMEVKTGNILCMVSLGSGVERGTTYSERVNNHALATCISPGSTMKLASAMALLEIGGYDLYTKVNTEHSRPNHAVKIGAARIEDSHDAAGKDSDGNVTLKDAFAHSSNVYFAKAIYESFKDDPKEYTDFLAKLRFNDYIGLEAYGERKGKLPMADSPEWNQRGSTSTRLPRLAYGYELDVPPIHMLTFYNGVANEGRMVAPRFVDRIERDGEVIEKTPVVTLIDKMCSKKTLALLDTCLAAASERTGRHFRDLAIPFGCKTGTAQMWSTFVSDSRIDKMQMRNGINGKEDNYYYGSIICTMPQEQPKYTIMVAVCKQATPESPTYFGIDLSAPVASDIMEYIYANDHTLHATIEVAEEKFVPQAIKGGKSSYVAKVGAMTNDVTDNSEGEKWSRATVEQNETTIAGVAIAEGKVPDVRGMGLSDALYLLERAGLTVSHRGSGRVKNQSLSPGRSINQEDMKIELYLER